MGFNRDSRGRVKLTNMVFVIPRCCHFEGKLYIGKAFECKKLHYFFLRSGMAFLMSMVLPTTLCTPNYHHVKGEVFPTGTANDLVNGEWIDGTERFNCNPAEEKNCYFKPAGDNSHLTCSIGYLHYLPSVHSYCKPEDIQGERTNRTENKVDLQMLQH